MQRRDVLNTQPVGEYDRIRILFQPMPERQTKVREKYELTVAAPDLLWSYDGPLGSNPQLLITPYRFGTIGAVDVAPRNSPSAI